MTNLSVFTTIETWVACLVFLHLHTSSHSQPSLQDGELFQHTNLCDTNLYVFTLFQTYVFSNLTVLLAWLFSCWIVIYGVSICMKSTFLSVSHFRPESSVTSQYMMGSCFQASWLVVTVARWRNWHQARTCFLRWATTLTSWRPMQRTVRACGHLRTWMTGAWDWWSLMPYPASVKWTAGNLRFMYVRL